MSRDSPTWHDRETVPQRLPSVSGTIVVTSFCDMTCMEKAEHMYYPGQATSSPTVRLSKNRFQHTTRQHSCQTKVKAEEFDVEFRVVDA